MGSVCHSSLEQLRGKELLEEEMRLHERVSSRDQAAVLEWLDRIGGTVYSAAFSLTGTAAGAEDMTAMLFLEVWRNPATFHPSRGPLVLQLLRQMRSSFRSQQASRARASETTAGSVPATLPPTLMLPAGS
jgi:DNA-directed RNA polymerase specialized sigma24 family protein